MSGARLLRIFAMLAFAVFAAAFWSTPGEAHAGHGAPQVAGETHAPRSAAAAGIADAAAAALPADCADDGGASPACCGHACHAAMAHDLPLIGSLPIAAAVATPAPEARALAGPPAHLKRPPRPMAATAG